MRSVPEVELNQFVVFKLGDEEFGIDVMRVREIARSTTITRVPRSPAFIDGMINLRGTLAPVINLRRRFGFELKEMGEETRIVIAELDGKPIGMIVDAATEVMRIDGEDIEETHEIVTTEVSKDYLKGIGKVGNRMIIILDLTNLLTKNEIREVEAFKDKRLSKIEEKEREKKKKAKGTGKK